MSEIIIIMAAMVDQSIKIINDITGCKCLFFQATINGANGIVKMKTMSGGTFFTNAFSSKKVTDTKR